MRDAAEKMYNELGDAVCEYVEHRDSKSERRLNMVMKKVKRFLKEARKYDNTEIIMECSKDELAMIRKNMEGAHE